MWRKRIKTTKRGDGRVRKGLSGRQLYRRQKESEGFLKDTCYSMWKSLPFEGKIYWNIKAQGKPQRSKRNGKEINKCLNKGASKPEENLTEVPQTNLSFMERTIHQWSWIPMQTYPIINLSLLRINPNDRISVLTFKNHGITKNTLEWVF